MTSHECIQHTLIYSTRGKNISRDSGGMQCHAIQFQITTFLPSRITNYLSKNSRYNWNNRGQKLMCPLILITKVPVIKSQSTQVVLQVSSNINSPCDKVTINTGSPSGILVWPFSAQGVSLEDLTLRVSG